jgi:predicted phosphodiesterase
MKLFDKYDIRNVLHGHLHESNQYFRHGIRFFNAGGTTLGYKNEIKLSTFIIENELIEFKINSIPVNSIKSNDYSPVPETSRTKLILPAGICLN